ncbi:MAG: hypothetical protein COC13_03815 [Methanobacteriota archaeon]|nr:MAG: hypothetical protein COC13_03815 [Euryarchaeota archaeon]
MTPWSILQYVEVVEPIGDAFTDWEVFYAAWDNQAAKLMPVEYQEEYKIRHWFPGGPTPGYFLQLSTPRFSPDATAVTAPTSFKLVTTGLRSINVRTS